RPAVKKSAEKPKPAKPASAATKPADPVAAPTPPQPPAESTTAKKSSDVPLIIPLPQPPPPPAPAAPEPPAEPVVQTVAVPSGTLISLRMIDSVDSRTDHAGQTFKASLEKDVVVNSKRAFRKGDTAYVKLTRVQQAGKVSGQSEIELQLDRLISDNGS